MNQIEPRRRGRPSGTLKERMITCPHCQKRFAASLDPEVLKPAKNIRLARRPDGLYALKTYSDPLPLPLGLYFYMGKRLGGGRCQREECKHFPDHGLHHRSLTLLEKAFVRRWKEGSDGRQGKRVLMTVAMAEMPVISELRRLQRILEAEMKTDSLFRVWENMPRRADLEEED